MELIRLCEKQIKALYKERMTDDFPRTELKPLQMMLNAIRKGEYECYSMEDNGVIYGYAYLVKTADCYLLDYFAIKKEERGKGCGGEFLALLSEYFKDARSLIVEVEDPSDNDTVKIRRRDFYLKNGFYNTDVRVRLFSVDYLLLELKDMRHSMDDVKRIYTAHYETMLPKLMFRQFFKIKENGNDKS